MRLYMSFLYIFKIYTNGITWDILRAKGDILEYHLSQGLTLPARIARSQTSTYCTARWAEVTAFKKTNLYYLHPICDSNPEHLGCEPRVLTTTPPGRLKLKLLLSRQTQPPTVVPNHSRSSPVNSLTLERWTWVHCTHWKCSMRTVPGEAGGWAAVYLQIAQWAQQGRSRNSTSLSCFFRQNMVWVY